MIQGKTKSGFPYQLDEKRLNNYELLEAVGDMEDNPLVLSKIVNLVLGVDQAKKLKDHLRTDEGLVPTDRMSDEITEIFQSQDQTKNS